MRNYFRQHFCPAPGGFTLVEMLVAVAMGAALIAAAAAVFAMASEAVGTSEANTQVNSQLRVLYSWLQRDFARIRLDGYLVLNPQEDDLDGDAGTSDDRFDQAYFMISGNIPTTDTAVAGYNASLAIVSYGPDDTVDYAPLVEPYDWIFTRRGMLIVSDDPAATIPADARRSSFAELLSGSAAASIVWADAVIKPNFDYDPAADTYSFDTNPEELPTYLLANIISFKIIQYYMAGDSNPIKYASAGWPLGTDKAFAPTETKPSWIEFEIVMRDANDRLEEPFTATYRVNLPSR